MSKRNITLIIIAVLILVGGGFLLYLYYLPSAPEEPPRREAGQQGFFPFGGEEPGQGREGAGERGFGTTTPAEKKAPLFRQISEKPVSGGTIFKQNGQILIRYNEQATGHIYETAASSTIKRRISNTTIPKVQNVAWSPNGEYFIGQYLGDNNRVIKSFYAKLSRKETKEEKNKENSAYTLKTEFLVQNMHFPKVSPSGEKIFFLLKENGKARGIISSPTGENKVEVFNSSLSHWRGDWTSNSNIEIFPAPSEGVNGLLLYINPSTGSRKKIISRVEGLTSKSNPNNSYILYTQSSSQGEMNTYIYDMANNSSEKLPIKTLPEKCVWSKSDPETAYCGVPRNIPQGTYPDDWYKGLVSFTDDIWKINAEQKTAQSIFTINKSRYGKFDVIEPELAPKHKYLLFKNKRDGTLWSLRIGD